MRKLGFLGALGALIAVTLTVAATAMAATTVVVTQNNTTWTQDDTRPGGSVTWSSAHGAPAGLGNSALRLQTDASPTAKAGLYTHTMAGTALSDVTNLSYWTYQAQANFPQGDASYQLQINALGATGFTQLVYEPYWNSTVVNGQWQQWDVSGGMFWASRTVVCSNGTL